MIRKILFLTFVVFANYSLYSQCPAYTANTACTTAAPINATPITCTPPNNNGGRRNFVVTNMIAGATYRVSNCGSGLDTQMTIRDSGGTVVGYNDDNGPACAGTASSINFIPPATGDYRIQMNRFDCATNNGSVGTITVTLTAGPPAACPGATTNFYDTGGAGGSYSNNENEIWTFYPDGGPVTATFSAFNTEVNWDYLYVYDGPNAGSTQVVGSPFSGNLGSIGPFTSTHATQTLTFVFTSDGSGTRAGWNATICGILGPCTAPPAPTALTFGAVTLNSIAGTFTGSGADNYMVLMNTTGVTPTAPVTGTIYNIGNTVLGATVIDNDANTNFNATGLNDTTTYYFYVYAYNNNGCSGGPVYSSSLNNNTITQTPISNDNCSGAIALTVNPDLLCGVTTSGTTVGASQSIAAITCGGFTGNADDDVWFSFVATSTSHIIEVAQGTIGDLVVDLRSGACNGANINCSDVFGDETINANGLTIGNTYFVRVYSYGGNGSQGTFDICVGTPVPPPNDNCSGAIVLTSDISCNTTLGSTEYASQSQIGCTGTADDDVWFSFLATGTEHTVTVSSVSIFDLVLQVFSGTCGSLTSIDCEDSNDPFNFDPDEETINLTGLTAGNIYFIRVYSWDSFSSDSGSFNICVTEPCVTPIDTTPNACEMVIDEAGTDPFAITPYNPNPSFTLDCNITSVDLATNAQMYETTTYDVIRIPYTYIGSLGATVNNSTISDDDQWADNPTAIGFPFCFYDNEYNYTLAGANSMITFDIDAPGAPYFMNGNNTPSTSCGYAFSNNLPSTAGSLFEQTIYGVYHDIDPRGLPANAITTRTQGVAGCRKFIAEWNDVPMFGDASREYSGMIVLYETTNIIEVYIEEKRIENGDSNPWNDGNAIVGIQGDITPLGPNNQYAVAPCRNGLDANWEVTNEAWRFVPSGNSRLTGVEWYIGTDTSGAPDATTNTYTATAPGTYTAISTYSTCGGPSITLTDEVVITDGRKTWNGSVSTNWYVDANWTPSGIPTPSDCVLIPDVAASNNRSPIADIINTAPFPPQPAYALNLTVANNGYLDVESETNLVVTDWVHLDGLIDIRDSGSLVQINDGAPNINNNTGSGAINMQRTATIASSYDYIYWSSPVEGFGVTNVSPGSSLIYQWIPTIAGNGAGNYGNWQATTEAMLNGKGYIIRNVAGTPTPGTPEFVGRPNNGVITKAITRGNYNAGDYTGGGNIAATRLDDNWNLVGNPYPSAISANTFLNANTNIAGTVYLWRHLAVPSAIDDPFYEDFVYNYNPNDYIAHNGTGSNPPGFGGDIGAGQAFFVLMEHASASTNENVIFNNTMRSASLVNSEFYRTNNASENPLEIEKHRIWLDLIAPNNTANSILVGYVENATNDVDRIFDGFELSETSNRFYSLINTEEMAIQGRALPFADSDLVALGVEISVGGNYKIALNTLDGLFLETDQTIYIEDTYTNILHNVRISPYSFNTDAGTFNDRFILRYTDNSLSLDDFNTNSGITITAPNSNYIKVSSKNSAIKSVYIYDMLGRQLIQKININSQEIIIDNTSFSEGAYIVKAITTNNMTRIEKVVLKR